MVVPLDLWTKRIQIAVALIFGFLLVYVYSTFSEQLMVRGVLGYDFVMLLIFLIGLQIGICFGILLEEETRAIGFLLFSLFTPVAIMSGNYIGKEFLIGLLIGVSLVSLAMLRNRLNLLPDASRILLTLFFLSLGYYLYNVFHLGADVKIIAICVVLLFGAYLGLMTVVKGSGRRMSVFVIGPGESGKTVLAGCIYAHIVFTRRISGISEKPIMLSLGGVDMALHDIYLLLKSGDWPPITGPTEARFFKLRAKKRWITPVSIELVDFGGTVHFDAIHKHLDPESYNKLVEEIGKELKETLEEDIPEEVIGTLDFMQWIKSKWEEENGFVGDLREKIIRAYICRSIMEAEKLIFLIDGKQVRDFRDNSQTETQLTKNCEVYRDIMNHYKGKKKYRLVITKTDEMDDLIKKRFYKNRRNVEGKVVEKWLLREISREISTFKEITSIGETVDAKLYAICLETFKDDGENLRPLRFEGGITLWNYDDFIRGIL